MVMTAHELAQKLLDGPDLPVWGRNPENQDYPLRVESVEGEYSHGSCEDNEKVPEGEDPITEPVILLDLQEDDGFLFD